jgi:hypothetical protein
VVARARTARPVSSTHLAHRRLAAVDEELGQALSQEATVLDAPLVRSPEGLRRCERIRRVRTMVCPTLRPCSSNAAKPCCALRVSTPMYIIPPTLRFHLMLRRTAGGVRCLS